MPSLKAKYNGEWVNVMDIAHHSHTTSEIVGFPSSMPNPNVLIVNGVEYDGSTSVDITEQIRLLVEAQLAEIMNAEEVLF